MAIDKHHPDLPSQTELAFNSNVTPFKPRVVTSEVTPSDQGAADADIVEMFERYLKSAKAGKIRFAAVACVDDTGIAISNWTPEESSPQLITQALGAISYLSFRFNDSCNEGAVESDKFQD